MTQLMEEKDQYLAAFADFEKRLGKGAAAPLHRVRQAAIERFAALGFPTLEDEEWRFTNLAPLIRTSFHLAGPDGRMPDAAEIERLAIPAGDCTRLVFVNGHYAPGLSSLRTLPPGTIAGSLAEALRDHPDQVEPHLARHAGYEEHPFIALNTAFLQDGAFLFIPRGKVVAEPVYLLFVSTAASEPTVSHPRSLVIVGEDSQVRLIEGYFGPEGEVYFTNAVTEVVAGPNAVVDHYKLQRESTRAFHVATLQVQQDRTSNFADHAITLGGGLVRNEINVLLGGEGGECTLNGLYLAAGRQHVDNRTLIDHAQPHCTSHELYRGILDGQAHGVFNGKIWVRPGAQKTDAKQTNQTLLLSEDAVINTKPQLEIYADDVKCTHGATVGQLDAEGIFYLRSRGISREEARNLLTFAFANDIIGRVKIEPLRARLEEMLLRAQHLSEALTAEEAP
ncbi:MAG TPA: Fe-S cluster assembly protein SufD [Gemmataceae bacterium]|nr:Fe-S cluster assembly protein SufD [Gemmataceae bacterium]